jgi:Domain of unknown function (DUF4365)
MSKTVTYTHIVGERGAIRLADYCNQHEPYMIFRPVTVNDFGIDGEIELTEISSTNKTTPTAQIIKVQIKSTAKDNSYMKKETPTSFEFYAKHDDIEYWEKYRQYGIKVLLIVFDDRVDKLYCKEISNVDIANSKPQKGKQSYPIEFSKIENCLEWGKHNFTELYSKSFAGRIKHDVKETLATNLFPFKLSSFYLYQYKSTFTDKSKIRKAIDENKTPYFVLNGEYIYTFHELEDSFVEFTNTVLFSPNYYIELLNYHIKDFMGSKGLRFSKEYKRYYFKLNEHNDERKAKYVTRTRQSLGEIIVAKQYSYGKDNFYRHFAIDIRVICSNNDLFLLINHKWFFTSDKRNPIEPKLITKYTNGMNNNLHNKEVLNYQHFWWSYLAWSFDTKTDNEMIIFNGKQVKQTNIVVGKYIKQSVEFGIPTDGEKESAKNKLTNNNDIYTQSTLFDL